MLPKKRRWLFLLGALWLGVMLAFVLWNQFGSVVEETLPDSLDFGRVYQGAQVEFSARFLTSAKKHPVDELFERIQSGLPDSWRGALDKVHPGKLRAKPIVLQDLSRIKPRPIAPPFVLVEGSRADQRTQWYGGKPFVVLTFNLDTSRVGEFSGEIEVGWDRRKAFLPVKVKIDPAPAQAKRLLITETPFESDSTEEGTNFIATTELLSKIPLRVDLLRLFPDNLNGYDTVLLAGGTLVKMTPEQIQQAKDYVKQGGRLVLAGNAFFVGTTAAANKITDDMGLVMQGDDHTGNCTMTNIVPDALTEGVRNVPFHRPSLITVTDPARAKILVPAGDEGGYVAVARPDGAGEVIVLAQSLWWWWLHQAQGKGDASKLMENILVRPGKNDPAE